MLLYLPLAHNYGRLLHLSAAYHRVHDRVPARPAPSGGRVAAGAADDLPERPAGLREDPRRRRRRLRGAHRRAAAHLVDWALGVGRRVSQLRQAKQPVPPLLAAQHRLADRLVYSKVKEKLGGRLRVANAGGAPLSRDIAEFFHSIDILVLEGYGLSEVTTAATVNRPSAFKFGTVGRPLPGVELRIAEDGEILIRSNTVFAGYYHDDEATRATIDDEGFVHTGDVATSTMTGFSSSPTAKKISSSPPAGKTSRRRTSRTS